MIQIAIVDDQTEAISGILSVFQQWEKENHVYFEIDTYTDADLFCDAIFDKKYQALFLDLDMPKKSGFDISQSLRELGNNTPIVYITNRDDLMQKAFQYKVLGFVRKDKIQEELPFAISCVVQEIQKKNSHVMIFAAHRQKKEYYNLLVSDILYIESENHQTKIYTVSTTDAIITRDSLRSYMEKEEFQGFIPISVSCIVNIEHIFSIEKDTVFVYQSKKSQISQGNVSTKNKEEHHMIYTVSEWLATISESLIIFFFLVKILSYKTMARSKKIIGTVVFCCLQCTSSLILDQFFVFEGLYVIITIFIYLLFCWIMLEKPIWFQTIVVLLIFACLFTINISTMLVTSLLIHSTSADVLLLRNPVRILLLFITKALLVFTLIILTNIFEKKKVIFHVSQCIVMAIVLLTTFFAGVVLEEIVIDTDVASWEVSAIVICMIAINILLFFVLYLTSSRNRVENNQALLKLQIANEQQKLQDSIRWNTEVNTLRHDLKNHLLCISEYIRLQQTDTAMEYIEKLTGQVKKELPYHMMTNSVAVNAILDLKKLVCDENQIDIKYFVLEELPKIDETDLCVILANLLDNAIEAASKEEKRQIRLSMEIIGNYFRIVVQNQIAESVLKNNKELGTTKKNRKIHGFGLQSVEDAVERNDGMSNFSEENGWFVADVMLKIHES